MVYFILESQVIAYDQGCQSRNSRQELKQRLGGTVITGLLPLPAKLLSYITEVLLPRTLSRVDWASSRHSLIKKMPQKHAYTSV